MEPDDARIWLTVAAIQLMIGIYKVLTAAGARDRALAMLIISAGATLWLSTASSVSGVTLALVALAPVLLVATFVPVWKGRSKAR